eukprot:7375873-Prymnesium_polylepis.1
MTLGGAALPLCESSASTPMTLMLGSDSSAALTSNAASFWDAFSAAVVLAPAPATSSSTVKAAVLSPLNVRVTSPWKRGVPSGSVPSAPTSTRR